VDLPPPDLTRMIDYVDLHVTAEHVLASAAIPVLFPAVRLDGPGAAGGWHVDGGVRLNAPLKPALALGADAVVVVSTHPAERAGSIPVLHDPGQPDVDDALVQLMDAALVDRMVEDLRNLARVNELLSAGGREARGNRPLRVVPWLFFGPPDRATLGRLAADRFDRRFGHLTDIGHLLRHLDLALLGRVLAGDGPRRGDVLSYLFFETEFVEAAIAQGQQDAEAVFAGAPAGTVPWREAM
jgi:NTE family protein